MQESECKTGSAEALRASPFRNRRRVKMGKHTPVHASLFLRMCVTSFLVFCARNLRGRRTVEHTTSTELCHFRSSCCLSCIVALSFPKVPSMCVQPESRLMSCGQSPRQNCRPRWAFYSTLNSASQVSKGNSASDYINFVKAMSAQLLFQLSVLTATFMLQLKDLKQELGALRVAKVTGGAPNKLSKM